MADVNPLDGQPLRPGQILVTGDRITGPRVTVVTVGSSLPPWISRLDRVVNGATVSSYFDNGIPGGTYQAQQLPDLVTTGSQSWIVVLVAIAVLGALAALKARGGLSWGDD